jgi:protein TonB
MIAARTEAPVEMTAPLPEPEPVIVEEPPPPPPPAAAPVPIIPPNFVAAYLDNPAPAYPASSKRLGETGTVLLRVVVDENGRPESINVTTSSGFERLDRAAIDAVRRWKFVPAKQGDRPVKAAVLVPLEFQLSS